MKPKTTAWSVLQSITSRSNPRYVTTRHPQRSSCSQGQASTWWRQQRWSGTGYWKIEQKWQPQYSQPEDMIQAEFLHHDDSCANAHQLPETPQLRSTLSLFACIPSPGFLRNKWRNWFLEKPSSLILWLQAHRFHPRSAAPQLLLLLLHLLK